MRKKIGYEPITSDEQYFEYLKYIVNTLWMIPSMVEKLPNHIYRRLEAVIEWRDKKGWLFDRSGVHKED